MCGFLFWFIGAKLYTIEEVGTATAIIASLNLVIQLSRMGFDFTLIRFLPQNKNVVYNSSFTITTLASIIVSAVYVLIINVFQVSIYNTLNNIYVFLLFAVVVVMRSKTMIDGQALLAIRAGRSYLIESLFLATRILFLPVLVYWGSLGVFMSLGIACLFASLFTLWRLSKVVQVKLKLDIDFVRRSFSFSIDNYLANMIYELPPMLIPILLISFLGEVDVARFYMTYVIGNLVLVIPEALSLGLLVEGSHGEKVRNNTIKACLGILIFLIPTIIVVLSCSEFILGLIKHEYVESAPLLEIFVVSGALVAFYLVFVSIQRIRMQTKTILWLNIIRLASLVFLGHYFMISHGLIGIGYAWFCTYLILNIVIIFKVLYQKWFVQIGVDS
ncbi:MAG: lipopolysaccharide biosynthesis protein [Firmicutes bacterium]|nr:lipopolysaccharide biosynthesis protein [Bacillota bacterium]